MQPRAVPRFFCLPLRPGPLFPFAGAKAGSWLCGASDSRREPIRVSTLPDQKRVFLCPGTALLCTVLACSGRGARTAKAFASCASRLRLSWPTSPTIFFENSIRLGAFLTICRPLTSRNDGLYHHGGFRFCQKRSAHTLLSTRFPFVSFLG